MAGFLDNQKLTFLILFFMAANILWIWIKLIINAKGYPTNFFWSKKIILNPFFFLKDFQYMHKVIAHESNQATKIKYRVLLYGLYMLFASFILMIALFD